MGTGTVSRRKKRWKQATPVKKGALPTERIVLVIAYLLSTVVLIVSLLSTPLFLSDIGWGDTVVILAIVIFLFCLFAAYINSSGSTMDLNLLVCFIANLIGAILAGKLIQSDRFRYILVLTIIIVFGQILVYHFLLSAESEVYRFLLLNTLVAGAAAVIIGLAIHLLWCNWVRVTTQMDNSFFTIHPAEEAALLAIQLFLLVNVSILLKIEIIGRWQTLVVLLLWVLFDGICSMKLVNVEWMRRFATAEVGPMKFLLGAFYSIVYFTTALAITSHRRQVADSRGIRALLLMTCSSVLFGVAAAAMGLMILSYWVLSSYDTGWLAVVVRSHIVGGLIFGLCYYWYVRLVFKYRNRLWTDSMQ